jgi:hypothetical protein
VITTNLLRGLTPASPASLGAGVFVYLEKNMPEPNSERQLPLLMALAARRGLAIFPIYSNRDVAELFNVSVRTIQDWITDNKILPRNLPGRGRFLPEDLEAFLRNSNKKTGTVGTE